ncbi:MAG TPA: hypothetical protein VM142_01675 [Acidimicrobiales bacterium]|nr:hypothetical protein [Acidimicrobiales bacterium]
MSVSQPSTTDEATVSSLRPVIGERRVREILEEVRRQITVLLSSDEPVDAVRLDNLSRRLAGAAKWARWARR